MTRVPTAAGPPRVGYAVGRRVGNAVVRNRVRRRLRAATSAAASTLDPGWAYLLSAGPGSERLPFAQLTQTVHQLLARARDEQ